jgi:uncharacterized protein (TIGR02145 family)
MKRLIHLASLLFISINLLAQAPQKMTYQAVIRNASNNLVVNTPVKMKISILQGSASGTAVYSELHNPTTNVNGLVTIEIGGGTSSVGTIGSINWGNGIYFLKTETDPNNGTNYSIVGTSQLLSVPYAFHSGNGVKGVSNFGDTLFLDNGKFIVIPGISNLNSSCQQFNSNVSYNTVTDIDGNLYKTIEIGTQTWMAENLRVSKYRNGTAIPNLINPAQWSNDKNGAWLYYDNNASYNNTYGKLYNWYAATNSNGICPTGWHLPSDNEWQTLFTFLDPQNAGNINDAGGKMKSKCPLLWATPNTDASNTSGFSALPTGSGAVNSNTKLFEFSGQTLITFWWTPLETALEYATHYSVRWDNNIAFKYGSELKTTAGSIRCVKD